MDTLQDTAREGRPRRMAMSVAEAALEAGVGRDHIYGAIKAGKLDARKLGRRTIVTYDALERFLNDLPQLQLPAA